MPTNHRSVLSIPLDQCRQSIRNSSSFFINLTYTVKVILSDTTNVCDTITAFAIRYRLDYFWNIHIVGD